MSEFEIFEAARRISDPESRRAYVSQACGDDGELCARVTALLQACEEGLDFLRAATHSFEPESAQDGRIIDDRYKLIQKIGEGGMGTVYMAVQVKDVRRKVAVKLVRLDAGASSTLARFDAERQALAIMDHPNIAKFYDAGRTSRGELYFAMELVKGVPITRYCDDHRLTMEQRIALFLQVCRAVQHAHLKGIIHRDLKPGNVLVAEYDGEPQVKVIDFGLAKALGERLTENSVHTLFGQILGTVQYMSPEQATLNQLDIDTRSDVYALAVLLYELLTGSTPHAKQELASAGLMEQLRIIREVDPPKPSTRLSSNSLIPNLAAYRQSDPQRLTRLLRGELDCVLMKGLEKERSRRYSGAAEFAADLERYLQREPVHAVPPSLAYHVSKRFHKNWRSFSAAALVLLVTIAGLVGVAVQEVRRSREAAKSANAGRIVAEAERRRVEAQQQREQAVHLQAIEKAKAQTVADAARYAELLNRIRERRERLEPGWTAAGLNDLREAAAVPTELRNFVELRSIAAGLLTSPDVNAQPDWEGKLEANEIVNDFCYSPSGQSLAVAVRGTLLTPNPRIELLDTASGRRIQRLESKEFLLPISVDRNSPICVRFGTDDKTLFFSTRRGTLYRWDLHSDPPKSKVVQASTGGVYFALTSDGKYLTTFASKADKSVSSDAYDRRIRCWNAENLELVGETDPLPHATKPFPPPQINASVIAVFSEGGDGSAQQLAVPTLAVERTLAVGGEVAIHPDGRRFLCNRGSGVQVFDSVTADYGQTLLTSTGSALTKGYRFPQFVHDGEILCCLNLYGNSVHFWRHSSSLPWATLPCPNSAGLDSFKVSAQGTKVAIGSGKLIYQYAVNSQNACRNTYPQIEPLTAIAVTPDDRELGAGVASRAVRRFEVSESRKVKDVPGRFECDIVYSPDGRWMVTSAKHGRSLQILVIDRLGIFPDRTYLVEAENSVRYFPDLIGGWGWSSEGHLVAALDSRLLVFGLSNEKIELVASDPLPSFAHVERSFVCLSWKSDEGYAINDRGILEHRTFRRGELQPAKRIITTIKDVASRCARYEHFNVLAVGFENGRISCLELPSGKLLHSVSDIHRDRVTGMFWQSQERLITTSRDGIAAVWQFKNGELKLDYRWQVPAGIECAAAPQAVNRIYTLSSRDELIDAFDLLELERNFQALGIRR